MHHNFLFDLDQTLLDFHASEYKALGIVLRLMVCHFQKRYIWRLKSTTNLSGWNLKKEPSHDRNYSRRDFSTFLGSAKGMQLPLIR